jgi:hypothetical protein
MSPRAVRAGSGFIHGNSSTPNPSDPLHLFESGEIDIDEVFKIHGEAVVGVRGLTAVRVEPKLLRWSPRWGLDRTK